MTDKLQHAESANDRDQAMLDAVQAWQNIVNLDEAVKSGDYNKLLNYPLFHFITASGIATIPVSGMSEGLPEGTAILNGAAPLILALCGRIEELQAASIAGKQS